MCGRITLRTNLRQISEEFSAPLPGFETSPRYNVSPGQLVLAVRGQETREIVQLKWGLIPSWSEDPKIAFKCLNARSETVATKPAFRAAYKSRRCLIPADGYYEWLKDGKEKLPHLHEFDGGRLFALAGLWERWHDVETCTILTTSANELAAQYHDRMPVILDEPDHAAWLAGEQIPLVPHSVDGMTARRVSQYVNSSRHEGKECIEEA